MPDNAVQRFIIVPGDNPFNAKMATTSFAQLGKMSRTALRRPGRPDRLRIDALGDVRVVDAVDLNEATLVEMSPDAARQFERTFPSLRIAPAGRLEMLRARPFRLQQMVSPRTGKKSRKLLVRVVDPAGAAIAGCEVIAVFDGSRGEGVQDLRTDAAGEVTIVIPARFATIERVMAIPLAGFWPAMQTAVSASHGTLLLSPTALTADFEDSLARIASWAPTGTGAGVKVAIIDGGTSLPDDPRVVAAVNFTGSEPVDDTSDNGTGHGTHVAGVVRRLAPEAEIHVYRVCAKGERAADELPIAKAIQHATDAGCDIINLSLGQDSEALAITRATRRARALGTVCVAAAGNDWGAAVSYPARSAHMIAVSACGHLASLMAGTGGDDNVADPPAAIDDVYFAAFSNLGAEIDLMAPGAGIISSVSATEQGVMDGTSMACPAAVGLLARALSARPDILARPDRDQERSDEIVRLGFALAKPLGFGREYEGGGVVRA